MKILHLNTSDIEGGAARGTYQLHRAIINSGVKSELLVAWKQSDDFTVIDPKGKIRKGFFRLLPEIDSLPLLFYKSRYKHIFSPSWAPSLIYNKIRRLEPDILHLHWICGGFVRPEYLAKINKPVVWTIRDMWGFTGGCHSAFDCNRYMQSCGNCPQLKSGSENDLSRKLWMRKNKAWKDLNITIVAISHWLADCAKKSSLFKNYRIEVIHNALDENTFKPIDKIVAKKILNIATAKKVILFGAWNATRDINKGFQYLLPAIQDFAKKGFGQTSELIIFGSNEPAKAPNFGMKTTYLGRLHDDITLALVYSAADVTVAPSIQEAFGKTAIESLACGTPVVSFDTTGLKDIVEHKMNGYRAKAFSFQDLAKGIAWILRDKQRYRRMSISARKKVEEKFTLDVCVQKYMEIYRNLLA